MKIYQPMMFVGLGGTGCQVGTELERRLREELCGPDGTALVGSGAKARFQLPDCLQFVYADYSETELTKLAHLSVPQSLRAAYGRTARATHNLMPAGYESSPEATRMLRTALHDVVEPWLPPQRREPKVVPLSNGAGQFPTVGRAALFATLRHSLEPVLGPLQDAINTIAKSAADLRQLGGGKIRGCDVFVAYSVAGGTGAGIFYDYLHLIGQAFADAKLRVRIYPLVVMPSAFEEGRGGGRPADLNASRAVVDLFRLIDDQNVPTVSEEVAGDDGEGPITVAYPGGRRISLRSGTVQTAFLFSRTAGIESDDLRRSIVSLVLSLIGTELATDRAGRTTENHQSFADSFINSGHERAARSLSGIGHQGVSTSLVASMTVPVNELAELLAGRLLAAAVRRLTDPARRSGEDNEHLVKLMFAESGLQPIWTRTPLPSPDEPRPLPRGGQPIADELSNRVQSMKQLRADLEHRLKRDVPELARQFAPRRALQSLLKEADLFRLSRVVNGQAEPDGPGPDRSRGRSVTTEGFAGMLNNRRSVPAAPPGVQDQPPRPGPIRRRVLGAVPPRWSDPEVAEALREQDRWYQWQSRRVWHEQWAAQEARWRPTTESFVRELARIVDAFRGYEAGQRAQFQDRTQELYQDRTGVSYLLPPQGNLKDFYDDAMDRLARHAGLAENDDEAGLLLRIVEVADWQQACKLGARDPDAAVTHVKKVLEQRIKALFTEAGNSGERPLLPSLADLLTAAAGDEFDASTVSKAARDQFDSQLANLLPGGFIPEGTGPLKVLITYPKVAADEKAEAYLQRELQPPTAGPFKPEFRPVADLDSITVVLFRSTMSLGEVPEVRKVLATWSRALREEGQEDYLAWRQRTGWQDDWLASTRADREHILHRLLCAMWNGQIEALGDEESPIRIRLGLAGRGRGTATFALDSYDQELSSWAGLLREYEAWTLLSGDPDATAELSSKLMEARPRGFDRTPVPPSALYHRFVHEIAPNQVAVLDELSDRLGAASDGWIDPLREFWERTVPAALELPFPNATRPVRDNLRELEASTQDRPSGVSRRRVAAPVGGAAREQPAYGQPLDGGTPPEPERYGDEDHHPGGRQPADWSPEDRGSRTAPGPGGPEPGRSDRREAAHGRRPAGADDRWPERNGWPEPTGWSDGPGAAGPDDGRAGAGDGDQW